MANQMRRTARMSTPQYRTPSSSNIGPFSVMVIRLNLQRQPAPKTAVYVLFLFISKGKLHTFGRSWITLLRLFHNSLFTGIEPANNRAIAKKYQLVVALNGVKEVSCLFTKFCTQIFVHKYYRGILKPRFFQGKY